MSIYNKANVFVYAGQKYERLVDHPEGMKYRIIFDENDYDYIENPNIIAELDSFLAG
jgi:hypothetical protein